MHGPLVSAKPSHQNDRIPFLPSGAFTVNTLAPALAALLSLATVDFAQADEPIWHKDLSKAKSIAKKSKRPLFVVFR